MDHDQLLNDFIDGTLEYHEEAELFAELSANDRLRSDLKALMLMQRGVGHDAAAYVPPAASTSAIFARLGYSDGSAAATASAGSGRFGPILHSIGGGLIGALLTLMFVTVWSVRDGSRDSGASIASHSGGAGDRSKSAGFSGAAEGSNADPQSGTTSSASGTMRSSTEERSREWTAGSPDHSTRTAPARERASSSLVDASRALRAPTTARVASLIASDSIRKFAQDERMRARAAVTPPVALDGAALASSFPVDGFAVEIQPTTFALDMRSLASRNFERVPQALDGAASTLLHDMALAVSYRVGDESVIGLEFGQETYYQRLIERFATGEVVQHEQRPLLPWVVLTYRHEIYRTAGLNPFVQGSIGGSQVGPTGRLMIGGYYEILPELRLTAGAEASAIAYEFGGTWYLSPKYGVTYGVSVSF